MRTFRLLFLLLGSAVVAHARFGHRRCGDGRCGIRETCNNCPLDCGDCSEAIKFFPDVPDTPDDVVETNERTLKVFFLFGQSNMQGYGCEDHLTVLVNDPSTSMEYSHLWDANANDWAERSDVRIRNCGQDESLSCLETAPLKAVGMGATADRFGPETGFGWTLGDTLAEDIFLCKAAWGGKDLAVDFRPPSSSSTNYNGNGAPLSTVYEDADPEMYSAFYNEALRNFQDCMNGMDVYAPGYDRYEKAGLVFFQGWNDLVNKDKNGEYYYNLKNLMTDMRSDLGVPTMPMVVGQAGQHTSTELASLRAGEDPDMQEQWDAVMAMRWAQGNATQTSINAALAETSKVVDRFEVCPTHPSGISHEEACGCQSYHYFNNAQIVYGIGVQMANEMLTMM